MHRSPLLWASVFSLLSFSVWYSAEVIYAQSQSSTNLSENAVVSVNSSITLQANNETLKMNQAALKSVVLGFLTSGPSILKTLDGNQFIITTKINNQINNTTQIVEGLEARNVIIGVRMPMPLKMLLRLQTNQL